MIIPVLLLILIAQDTTDWVSILERYGLAVLLLFLVAIGVGFVPAWALKEERQRSAEWRAVAEKKDVIIQTLADTNASQQNTIRQMTEQAELSVKLLAAAGHRPT